jgi:hypothetical protein
MNKQVDIFDLLRKEKKLTKVLVYSAQSVENDPTEHTVTDTLMNAIAIQAYVRQVTPESIVWKYYGNIRSDSLQIICEKRWYETLLVAKKIVIDDIEYKTLYDDTRGFSILKREDYLVLVAVRNNG